MNRNLLVILTILVIPLCVYLCLDKFQYASASKINYNLPTVIKFASEMCSECQKMQRTVDEVSPKYQSKINFLNVNVQKRNKDTQALIKEYNVTLVPTLIFKKSNGQIVKRYEGAMTNSEFEYELKRLINE